MKRVRGWTSVVGALVGAAALVVLACGGGGETVAPVPLLQQPQQPAQPAPAAPALESQPAAVPAPALRVSAPAAPAAPAAPTPRYGGTASFFVRGDPRGGFEPQLDGARWETRAVTSLALETLGIYDTLEGQPCTAALRPLLAESWRFLDSTTVEIKLRQGVKFQNVPPVNGRELVAADVVFSYRRMFDQGPQPSLSRVIASMEAVDTYTVRIKTKAPAPLMTQDLFAWRDGVILAKEAADKEGRYDKRENIIGTGPFILTEYTPGVGHAARRNPDYWVKGRPYLDGLQIPMMREQSTRIAALQVGKLDLMEEAALSERQQLIGRKADVRFVDCEGISSSNIVLRNDLPPFNDVRVRRALSISLDREAIVKGIFQGDGSVRGVAAGSIEGALKPQDFPLEVRKYLQYNPTEARRLLAEAGYPNGLDLEVFGTLAFGGIWTSMFEALPGMLRPGGFNVKLKTAEMPVWAAAVANLNYGVAGVYRAGGHPIESALARWHSKELPTRNQSVVKDLELDELIEKMLVTVDPAERLKIVHQIQVRMVDRAYFVMYPVPVEAYGVSRRLQGNLRVNAGPTESLGFQRGLVFQDVWVADWQGELSTRSAEETETWQTRNCGRPLRRVASWWPPAPSMPSPPGSFAIWASMACRSPDLGRGPFWAFRSR